MALSNILFKIGNLISSFKIWDFILGASLTFGQKLFRFYGLVAFITMFVTAGITAFHIGGTPLDILLSFILELVKTIIATDQQIYDIAVSFYFNPANHTVWQGIITSWIIISKSFFYLWWFRIIRNLVKKHSWVFPINIITQAFGLKKEEQNASLQDSRVNWISFKIMYVFMVFINIFYLIFISKTITFDFVPVTTGFFPVAAEILKNTYIFINSLFSQFWVWILAFKGLLTGFVLVIMKTAFMIAKVVFPLEDYVTNDTIGNITNNTIGGT